MTQQPWPSSRPPQTGWPAQGGWPQPVGQRGQQLGQQRPGWPQGSPWQQGPFPPQQQPQQQRRGGGLKTVLIGVMVLCLLLAGLFMVMGLLRGGSTPTDTTQYKNEGYQAPPPDSKPSALPEPTDYDQATLWLTKNAIYNQPVQVPVRCDVADLNLDNASDQQLESHMNDVIACILKVWVVPVQAAGFELPRPAVHIYHTPLQTRCGKLPLKNAVYCGADQQVYYNPEITAVMPANVKGKRWTVESIIAHEMGHAIQARTGILISGIAWEGHATDEAESLRFSRRIELQADCFAGTFLHAVSQSMQMTQADLGTIKSEFYAFGDDVLTGKPDYVGNHGHAASRQYWVEMGLAAQLIGSCNTFTAPDNQLV